MSHPTSQAQNLINELRALGLPRDLFRVRTDITKRRDNGHSYREYGDALVIPMSRDANRWLGEHAQILADRYLTVTRFRWLCGHDASPLVTSQYNRRREVETITLTAHCGDCEQGA